MSEVKRPTDAGGHMKPGKNIFNISFGVDEHLLQAYCHLGLGAVSKMTLLDSLGLITLLSIDQI